MPVSAHYLSLFTHLVYALPWTKRQTSSTALSDVAACDTFTIFRSSTGFSGGQKTLI